MAAAGFLSRYLDMNFFFFSIKSFMFVYIWMCVHRNILVNIAVAISAKVLFFFLISLSK